MANKVKVVGYAQRVFYNNGIEYRNFSDNLVGNQITSPNAVFTSGNFTVETNFDEKINKSFITKKFSPFMSLEDLMVDEAMSAEIENTFSKAKLNLDKSNLAYYAYFGSLVEYIRVSLEGIIMKWPASLYVRNYDPNKPITGNTAENYTYNLATNESTFNVNVNFITNKFDINHKINGTLINTYNETNDSRNLTVNYSDYVISINGDDKQWSIIGFTGNTNDVNDYITIKVEGDVFNSSPTTTLNYHIKPNSNLYEEFFAKLPDLQSYLLNRKTQPQFKALFDYKAETETGMIINTSKEVIWPTSDGYNIDFDTSDYITYVKKLIEIAEQSDNTKSNLMVRQLVSDSISDFDTIPNYDGGYEDNAGQKMNRTLKIYGREFDEIKKHIDGIKFANRVTYDKKDNTPDLYLKNIARVLGWELVSSVLENDLLKSFLTPKNSTYSGHSIGYTAHEAEIELWRRLILNSPWIWKSKGTRKSIDFFLKFIGAPNGLITFNEYIYRAKKPLNIELFKDIMDEFNGDTTLDGLNIDYQGFPKVLPNTPNMYFQKGGQWYRETTGPKSNIDIHEGNNPHMGPYDNGQEYISQFDCLIPNFEPVIINKELIYSNQINMFTNYNSGLVDNTIDSEVYLNSVNNDNLPISDCYDISGEIIEDPKPSTEMTDCGCETGEGDDAIKISIKRKDIEPTEPSTCSYTGFTLDGGGYIVFGLPNGGISTDVGRECCESLNFTYNSGSSTSCWWNGGTTVELGPCNDYEVDYIAENGLITWINYDLEVTTELVSSECCESLGYVPVEGEGNTMCYDYDPSNCSIYSDYATNLTTGVVKFIDVLGNITTDMPPLCCSAKGYATMPSGTGFNCINTGALDGKSSGQKGN